MRMLDVAKRLHSRGITGSTKGIGLEFAVGRTFDDLFSFEEMIITNITSDYSIQWHLIEGGQVEDSGLASELYARHCKVERCFLRRSLLKKFTMKFICEYLYERR